MHKIESIQILRGLAALLVVFLHACHDVSHKIVNSIILNFYNLSLFGGIGIDIFFIISGFIMIFIHGYDFNKKKAPVIFLLKRLIRIVPLYWIFTLFSAAILLFFPELFTKGKQFDLSHLISSLLFFPWYNSVGEIFPVLPVGWSLNVELYFYFIFSLTLFFPRKYFYISISAIFISVILLVKFFNLTSPFSLMVGNYIVLEFLIGIYLGLLYQKNMMLLNYWFWIFISTLLIFSNIFIMYDSEYRVITTGIPCALLIYAMLSIEKNKKDYSFNRWLFLLGNASYSIYITHIFFYKGTIKVIYRLFGEINPDVIILISVLLSILGGFFIYLTIEKPMYLYMNKKYTLKL